MTTINTPRSGLRRVTGTQIPAEGADGLFSESWYPICQSTELAVGEVRGEPFLDGRVVAFRGQDGTAQVLSAYCPHLGADLSVGSVHKNTIRCGFHNWQYDLDGTCIATGCGDPPPKRAQLFAFPTRERYGIVWAFNGHTPTFDFPTFDYSDDELVFKNVRTDPLHCDPWVVGANVPDIQHLKSLHGFVFDSDPTDNVTVTDHSVSYHFSGTAPGGAHIAYWLGMWGTNIFYQHSTFNGRWFGWYVPFGIPTPGQTTLFPIIAARRCEGTDEENQAFLEEIWTMQAALTEEDLPILNTIHFRPGTLTTTDRALTKYLHYIRKFPRTHPAADFIN